MNKRVEELQQSIRKSKKAGVAATVPTSTAPEVTATATDFLAQMRADVALGVEQTRERLVPRRADTVKATTSTSNNTGDGAT